ncbi:hypothetical protein [Martelella mangrovi]|uniref:Co/Zn/Cd efflux system component n=1 Tax=Martelella mangrovi TaxID=1397477 RepID=A0ABV2IIF5_9HYPH
MLIISVVVAVLVFIGFMSLVGSPSEVETIIGLVIAAIAFLATYIIAWRMRSKAHEEDKDEKIAALERELASLKSKK